MVHYIPFPCCMQAKAHLNQKGGWEAVEQCLHTRDARGKSMLLLLENAKDAQGTPQAAQVSFAAYDWCRSCCNAAVALSEWYILWAATEWCCAYMGTGARQGAQAAL